jgi:hypothetical protein
MASQALVAHVQPVLVAFVRLRLQSQLRKQENKHAATITQKVS